MDNQTVGTGAGNGAGSSPNDSVSQQAQAPIEGDVTSLLAGMESKLAERFESLSKNLTGQLEGLKKVQGDIDRSQTNFQSQLAKFNQIKTQGNLSDEQAMEVMQRGDAEAQRWQSLEQKLDGLAARLAGAGTQADGQQAVTKVFESVGLDTKDPRVASALMQKYENADAVELAAYRLLNQVNQSPNPTTAQSASIPGGGSQGSAAALDALYVQYEQAAKAPTKNATQLANLEQQIKALGG